MICLENESESYYRQEPAKQHSIQCMEFFHHGVRLKLPRVPVIDQNAVYAELLSSVMFGFFMLQAGYGAEAEDRLLHLILLWSSCHHLHLMASLGTALLRVAKKYEVSVM